MWPCHALYSWCTRLASKSLIALNLGPVAWKDSLIEICLTHCSMMNVFLNAFVERWVEVHVWMYYRSILSSKRFILQRACNYLFMCIPVIPPVAAVPPVGPPLLPAPSVDVATPPIGAHAMQDQGTCK